MKRLLTVLFFALFILGTSFYRKTHRVFAQTIDPHPACPADQPACYPTTVVYSRTCNQTCVYYDWWCSGNLWLQCGSDPSDPPDDADCGSYGFCTVKTCRVWSPPEEACGEPQREDVHCSQEATFCGWTGTVRKCSFEGELCVTIEEASTQGCCGPGGATPTPGSGPTPTPTPTPAASCTVDLTPVTASISIGASQNFTASVVPSNGTVDQVNFSSSNTGVATVNPGSDASSPYRTSATGVSVGNVTITSDVVMSGVVRCSDSSSLEITPPGPWWQVKDADIITNGNLISPIPTATCVLPGCNPVFGLDGPGGYPGVPGYGGTTADFEEGTGTGTVSSTNWLANSTSTFRRVYGYSYFQSLIRPDVEINEISEPEIQGGYLVSQGNATRGYVWFRRQGDLTITGTANLQDRKVVLLVDGDLYLGRPPAQSGSSIRIRDGSGFFMAIVSGDIIISPKVVVADPQNPEPILEGIFLAEGQVKTGTYGTGLDGQLWLRGSVAAYGGVVLERDLTGSDPDNTETPAEFFEYGPDLLFTYPRDLTYRRYRWKEVAP